jgi:hypothetical protein
LTIDNRFMLAVSRLLVLAITIALSGYAQAEAWHKPGHRESKETVSVLLMPIDIELSVLTTGGVKEVRADWTATAEQLASQALRRELAQHKDKMVLYEEPSDPETAHLHSQITKLHATVGTTMFVYSLLPSVTPPTAKDSSDWSLGEEVSSLRETSGADYGLFVYLRDSYSTAGRKALIGIGALFGVSASAGSQVGFATLVDLRDGSVVWFNTLARGSGDLRTESAAQETIAKLMKDLPL